MILVSLNDSIHSISNKVAETLEPHVSHGPKNQIIAAILGFFFPGTGHMYIWETEKGVKLFLLWIGLIILSFISGILTVFLIGFFLYIIILPAMIILSIYAAYDGYKLTADYNEKNNYEASKV